MKKFIIALAACLVIGTSAFAGGNESFSIGYTYQVYSTDNAGVIDTERGSGIYIDNYNSFMKFFGLAIHGYISFPTSFDTNGHSYSSAANHLILGISAMPAFNLPIGNFLDLRIGAGLGFMINHQDYSLYGVTVNQNIFMLTVPVAFAAQFKFGSFIGLKVGCDVQFEIKGWIHEDLFDTSDDYDYKGIFVNPYIAVTFTF